MPKPLGHNSTNVLSTVDELDQVARARSESGGTVESMQERVVNQNMTERQGLVDPGSDLVLGVKEVSSRYPEEIDETRIGPRVQDLIFDRPLVLVTEQSALTLTIAAEVVDENPYFSEAEIQERLNRLRDKMVRDTVQADAVKVTAESELLAPKHQYGCWLIIF